MTAPSSGDIHVILPGGRTGTSPRRALRAALTTQADVIVVVAPGDDPNVAARLAAQVASGAVAVAFSWPAGRLRPGAGPLAIRRDVLAGLDITEDWPAVGYEIAAQLTAAGGAVATGAGRATTPAPTRAAAVRLRWLKPVVWRRERLARRRAP